MRHLIFAAVAAAALISAGSLASTRAEAMPMQGNLSGNIGAAVQAEPVRLVCSRVWNGYRWVRSCYETGRRYYGPRPYYGSRRGHHHSPRGHHHGHRRGHR